MSTVITAVHCGPAEGSQPVLVHQVTMDRDTSDMTWAVERTCKQAKTQQESLKEVLLIQEPKAYENDLLDEGIEL